VRSSSLLLIAIYLFLASACGNSGPAVTDAQSRSVSKRFITALLAAPTKQAAVRVGQQYGGDAVAETAAFDYSDLLNGGDGLHAYAGPRRGCEEAPKDKHCYTFYVVGRLVPERGASNKGYADIEHGALFVYVQARGTPKIKNYTFAGGSRTCKLHFNCASAHREKVRLAKKFQY
jgi:hypothetical protein